MKGYGPQNLVGERTETDATGTTLTEVAGITQKEVAGMTEEETEMRIMAVLVIVIIAAGQHPYSHCFHSLS